MKTVRLGDYINEYCEKNKKGEDIPVYSVTNTNGFCTEYFSKDVSSKDKSNYKIVLKGFFAYNPSRINVGSVDWLRNEEKVIVSPLYNVFSVSPELDNQYLYYFLKSDMGKTLIKSKAEGSVRDNLKLSILSEFPIPLPSIEEQRKFATKIDKCNEIIKQHRLLLEKYDTLIKSRFIEMFGDPITNPMNWDTVNISSLLTTNASNGFFAKRDEYTEDGNVEVLGVVNVVNTMYSKIDFLPKTNASDKDIIKYSVKYGDMLFCRSSLVAEGIGKASIVPENINKTILFECHVIRLRLDLKKCVPEYMQMISTTSFFRNQVLKHAKTSTMTTIGQDGILKTDVRLPPIEKQKQFLSFIKQIDKSKFEIWLTLQNYGMIRRRVF